MGYMMEGTVYIESINFWAFVQEQDDAYSDDNEVQYDGKLYLDKNSQEIYVKTTDGIIVWLDMMEFWEFVLKYTPCNKAEYVFGVPSLNDFDLTINFAANTEGNPTDQSNLPACLQEWKIIDG